MAYRMAGRGGVAIGVLGKAEPIVNGLWRGII